MALAALVRSWWVDEQPASDRVLEKAAKKISHHQRRNAQARQSHTKTRKIRLKSLGIDADRIKSCIPRSPT